MSRRYYDESGNRVPDPRGQSVPLGVYVASVAIGILIGVLVMVSYAYWHEHQTKTTAPVTYFSAVGTIGDGGNIHIYTWSDPDSGRTYFVTDRGGICERNLEVLPE